ncbi:hypothetical protein OHT20_06485 [Streptomyces caniferus]|uniref:Uncharacterized protein n=1 Tax=Streptomyces caniferus TaxID=285557 RepID=A0ABZ1VF65_9ACTN|nr:hypothetical protein [Streptomyces caniferus]
MNSSGMVVPPVSGSYEAAAAGAAPRPTASGRRAARRADLGDDH